MRRMCGARSLMRDVGRPLRFIAMASRKPFGVWVVALTTLVLAGLWVLSLLISWFTRDHRDSIITPWETGDAPIHIAVLTLAIASAIGLLCRRSIARVGLLCALVLVTGIFALTSIEVVAFLRSEFSGRPGTPWAWIRIFFFPLLSALGGVAAAASLYGKSGRQYFSETPSA
jgi:hypothetical protein